MQYLIEQISNGEDTLTLRYQHETQEVSRILAFMNTSQKKLIGAAGNSQVVVDVTGILYAESVDGKSFVYTENEVLGVDFTLAQLEQFLSSINFFRCSKSMIINIDKVSRIKSLASNRIDATMCSGEHIIISRTYASDFRKRLKGVNRDE